MIDDWSLMKSNDLYCAIASNTRRLKATCVLLQKLIEREVLFLGCRHSIFYKVQYLIDVYNKYLKGSIDK